MYQTAFEPSIDALSDEALLAAIENDQLSPLDLPAPRLSALCQWLNGEYRAGRPRVSDAFYDQVLIQNLRLLNPDDPFLHTVEPEGDAFDAPTVRHSRPMLSTDKAYSLPEIKHYLNKVGQQAAQMGQQPEAVLFRVTPKLDGIACRDEGARLVTRGDGLSGSDITYILERGAVVAGGRRDQGDGEIVVLQDYFLSVLKPTFGLSHPRNFITGFCGADSVKDHHRQATDQKAVVFVPYVMLDAWTGTAEQFMADWKGICERAKASVPYLTDGVIIEVVDADLKSAMGATSDFHRWMLAIKEKGETGETNVRDVVWQTGRTGRITPVAELEPIHLSSANISRVTVHHGRMIQQLGIGPGARCEIIRAGEVIPKIESVITPVEGVVPDTCPCCGHATEWDGDYLICPNSLGCSAQVVTGLQHFFRTLGNNDGFGPKTIETLVAAGHTDLRDIYALDENQFQAIGFGPGQAANLVRELARSRRQEIEDWRFLAAFGIRHLGRGDSRRLLESFELVELTGGVTAEEIATLKGFGDITSVSIATSLRESAELINSLRPQFRLRLTGKAAPAAPVAHKETTPSPLQGKHVVFTGTMTTGSREALQEQARALGAIVQSGVNGKTDYLICGEKVGASKTAKAEKLGVTVLSEMQYLFLMKKRIVLDEAWERLA